MTLASDAPVAVAFWLEWNNRCHGIVLTEARPVWADEFSVRTDEGFRSGQITLTLHGKDAVAICPISELSDGSPLVLHVNEDGSCVEHPTFRLPLWHWL